jgi:hypothetical protein
MVNIEELIGTTGYVTLYARCRLNRCRYNRVRLYCPRVSGCELEPHFQNLFFNYMNTFYVLFQVHTCTVPKALTWQVLTHETN